MTTRTTYRPSRARRTRRPVPTRGVTMTRSNDVEARRVRVKGRSPRDVQLTREEILSLCAALAELATEAAAPREGRGRPQDPRRYQVARLLVRVCAMTGARIGELLDLRAQDVTCYEGGLTRVWLEREKGSRPGYVPVGNATGEELGKLAAAVGAVHGQDAYVFASSTGRALDQGNLSRVLKVALAHAGIELHGRQTWHALRHHAAWRTWEKTRDVRSVQALLGHTTPAVTSEYLCLGAQEREELVADAVEGLHYD